MNDFPKFWIVLSDDFGDTPICRHGAESLARFEAAQLAAKRPGSKYFVLECIAAVAKAEVQWFEAKEMPF